ncbi:hypothetical protein BMS3Abin09_01308 [bacterium BMS3Abin09]|nr:hypothetical protein BMS3Abin09_01308 [bacterium BMS3Abin09]
MSALTIDISSITIASSFLYISLSFGLILPAVSGVTSGLKLKKEWTVCPFTLTAATPVGASTAIFFLVVSLKYSRRVDLPVPALPVIKTLLSDLSITCRAWRKRSFSSIFFFLVIVIPALRLRK